MRTVLLLVCVAACAHNVNQDMASGPDAKIAGAKKLKIGATKLKETGIVTYPGGDRVDWKAIEIPTGKHGRLDVTLTYTTPRPGLHVSFDMFDRYQARFEDAQANYKTERHTRTASLADVSEKVFIRVYAPKRGDAGKYTLVANFVEAPPPLDLSKLNLPLPPPLAEVKLPCTADHFDKNDPDCHDICPTVNPPRKWPACEKSCDGRDDPSIKACADTMPCDNKNDPRIKSCADTMACTTYDVRIAACRKPLAPPAPIYGSINHNIVLNGDQELTIAMDRSDQTIAVGWPGTILIGGTEAALDRGSFVVEHVEKHGDRQMVRARVHLTPDKLKDNLRVKIQGPTPTRSTTP